MRTFFLIKPGEIELKLGNRREFVHRLKEQIQKRLHGIHFDLEEYPGRFFLSVEEKDTDFALFVLQHCPGVNGIAQAIKSEKRTERILKAAIEIASKEAARGARRFKVETRRSDKSFPLDSYGMSAAAGDAVTQALSSLSVDVHNPDFIIAIEIRERAYIYASTSPGPRGLPVGSQGKGVLLLSGGIDSPVAGYMMARRGLAIESVYFHTYPFTSEEAQKKVEQLARRIAIWTGSMHAWIVSFTEVQLKIKKGGREEANTLMLRMAMMKAADVIASRIKARAIVTGESLGQVASQTAENLRLSQSMTSLPVLRPLIGIDKEETIATARRIGTYTISILPYEDCCVLFSPKHPVLKPDFEDLRAYFSSLELESEILKAVDKAEEKFFSFGDALREYGLDAYAEFWNAGGPRA
ncbi:MAG: tRNA uracil 4-sulfurtransferase ThiI [Spirochaetia bacterium]|jgi:thiamine biosynthesis protein ThiI|uniref:Probable tRNA sulfurtransferase n=1 Tax=uncultured spirochete TaxID=156406 RepID=A0A3P3XGM6_9SPIR|nr:tRNA uracil 4-sulfurtransferase ThiI [Rectinema subterraneum]MDQ7795428.1 tRNA uracil 4-sulfurtransferase ThiI [Spirochaetia bacterium]SLM09953.1 putative tRNA sulfurtransferase [uncultured spirochete]HBE45808.1 tRNA 4-thiouridine(8) synthase ThiI [Spirochaetaceae bacterium]